MSSYKRCNGIVDILMNLLHSDKELSRSISDHDIQILGLSCSRIGQSEITDRYSEPMVWIGIYIAIASFVCIVAMAADLFHGFRNKKFWFPCKYFTLNAASITVVAVTMKLPVDLSSEMPDYTDQAAKLASLSFMCTMMANFMPSLASMDNKTLLANVIGLCILVITMIVNIFIQINTGVIFKDASSGWYFKFEYTLFFAYIYLAMILMLLIIMISSSLTILTSKELLESKYRAKIALIDQRLRHIEMSKVEKLRQHVRRYWVMGETGSPQFVMASSPLSTASGVICVIVMVINVFLLYVVIRIERPQVNLSILDYLGGSPYKWSTTLILFTQTIGVIVGTIAPIFRCFLVFNFKLGTKWNMNYFTFFKVEKYYTQKLHEWKQSPVLFLSSGRRSRSLIYNLKNIILSLCIGFQKVVVILCKVTWFIVIVSPIFVVYCWKSMKAWWFTPPITSRTNDIDEDLNNYVLQTDNRRELAEKTLKSISKSMNSFILEAEKEQNNNLLELLEKSTGFKGVEIFDNDHVQSLLSVELVNSWSLPVVTLTCIAVALPDIPKEIVGSLFESVDEGLSFTHLVEECLNSASEYVSIRKTTQILWHEVENKCKWLDHSLVTDVFKAKTTREIVEWFSNKAKQTVTKLRESTNGEPVEIPSHTLIAANSMYRITQTILLGIRTNIEERVTKEQLFSHLNGMIADIFSACFTNIPRVITMRCHESAIEKREASVKVAARLLGKTTKMIEKLDTLELPIMDDDKMARIDDWRFYFKQSIP